MKSSKGGDSSKGFSHALTSCTTNSSLRRRDLSITSSTPDYMQRSEASTQYNSESIKRYHTSWTRNPVDLKGIYPTQKKTCSQLCNPLFAKTQDSQQTDKCQDSEDCPHQLSKALKTFNSKTNTTRDRHSNSLLNTTLILISRSYNNTTILWTFNSNSSLQTNRDRRQELINLARGRQLSNNTTRASTQLTSYQTWKGLQVTRSW